MTVVAMVAVFVIVSTIAYIVKNHTNEDHKQCYTNGIHIEIFLHVLKSIHVIETS